MQNTALRTRVERGLAERMPTAGRARWSELGAGVGGRRFRLEWGDARAFVKTGEDADLFAAEVDGLAGVADAACMRVPRVFASGEAGGEAFIVMEWLPLAPKSRIAAARLGEALARQHLFPAPGFGWRRDNFIGATPQFNAPSDDWIGFFRERRLLFQLRLAAENGYRGALQEMGAQLAEALPRFFTGYAPRPALLHGDLWGGNWGVLEDGVPVVFDPAVYRGDREAELAMTELFGGFGAEFHAAYRLHAPLDAGYAARRGVYQLYHVLNHLNLFGEAYLGQAQDLVERLLAEQR
ncbi:MAG TPA: fructosamine kinase family protein [Gammaproteobacteria bacterium]|nr:fructosamine kinase family protein [Gammaproteobacteria bacterium]